MNKKVIILIYICLICCQVYIFSELYSIGKKRRLLINQINNNLESIIKNNENIKLKLDRLNKIVERK